MSDHALLDLLNKLVKKVKRKDRSAFYLVFATSLINPIIHVQEHRC